MRFLKFFTTLKIEKYSLIKKHLFNRKISQRTNKILCYVSFKLRHAQELYDFLSGRIDFAGRRL